MVAPHSITKGDSEPLKQSLFLFSGRAIAHTHLKNIEKSFEVGNAREGALKIRPLHR